MEIKRRPFQGVLNILDFNRHFYFYGLGALLLLIVFSYLIGLPSIVISVVILAFAYGLIMPLLVSAYVYDFSNYYSLDWLKPYVEDTSEALKIVNINAGFDETSFLIKNRLKNADLRVYDFYDKKLHTERAIVRARNESLVYPATEQIDSNLIPQEEDSIDIVFLLSSAHEIRDFNEKVTFLRECKRICKADGKLIMVEHLRDFPNFMAFTMGFTHFFSKNVWKKALRSAGFSQFSEEKFTPFMSIFECKP